MTKNRTNVAYRIDMWTDDGENILEHLYGMQDFLLAILAYRAACERWPNAAITLRQGARVIEDSRSALACATTRDAGSGDVGAIFQSISL